MEIELNLDENFANELDLTNERIDLSDIDYVKSGMFKCFIVSAFKNFNQNTGATKISCEFAVYGKDTSDIIGKFNAPFDADSNSKFFVKTKELAFLTDNKRSIQENTFTDKNGVERTTYPCLCNKPIVCIIYRKPEDYITSDGQARGNYILYGLYNTDKKSVREILKNVENAQDYKNTYNFLKSKIETDGGEIDNNPKPTENPVKTTEKPVKQAKVETVVDNGFDDEDIPF